MPTPDHIHLDQPSTGLQRLAARFGGHAFDAHRHETYAVGLTLWGAQSFHYRGALRTSRGGQVMVIHPDERHDGHASVDQGFAYRMLYVDPGSVGAALGGTSLPFVPDVVADDAALAGLLQESFADFPRPLEPLAHDEIVERLATLLAARSDGLKPKRDVTARVAAIRARDFLTEEYRRTIDSVELERITGFDRFALARHFRATFGTSPHRFQVGRRLAKAQELIVDGMGLAESAAAAGFADQSHMTRHFAARYGLTPRRFAILARA